MKKLILLAVFALMFIVSAPKQADALLLDKIFDDIPGPHCLISDCDDDDDDDNQTVNNTYNNSNNVNSNINSPNSNVITTGGGNLNTSPNYNYDYDDDNGYNPSRPLDAHCYATPTYGEVGERISWRASINGGDGNYHVTWDGTEGLDGNGTSITVRYDREGTKNASIRVRSGDRTIYRNCSTSVDITDDDRHRDYNYNYDYDDYDDDDYYYGNLSVSCNVSTTFALAGTQVTWQAQAYGGRGNYTYSWDGHDNLSGSGRTRTISYHSPGSKSASVTVRSGNQRVTQQCSNSVLIGVPAPQYQNPYPVYTPPVVQAPVKAAPKTIEKVVVEKVVIKDIEDERETTNEEQTSVVMFSLDDIPWGWVAILVILVLFMTVVYLLFNKTKI